MKTMVVLFILGLSQISFVSLAAAIDYKAEKLRDPFESSLPTKLERAKEGVSTPNLKVNGLVWGSQKPQAVINDKVVSVGEEVEGARVIEISKEGVTVLFGGKLYELKPERMLK